MHLVLACSVLTVLHHALSLTRRSRVESVQSGLSTVTIGYPLKADATTATVSIGCNVLDHIILQYLVGFDLYYLLSVYLMLDYLYYIFTLLHHGGNSVQ